MRGSSDQPDEPGPAIGDRGDGYLEELAVSMRRFCEARGWSDLHTPKNLAMALAGEAGELAAEFQWLTPDGSERGALSSEQVVAIESEMADVLIYLVQLADRLGTSLPEAVATKMVANETRFPPLGP